MWFTWSGCLFWFEHTVCSRSGLQRLCQGLYWEFEDICSTAKRLWGFTVYLRQKSKATKHGLQGVMRYHGTLLPWGQWNLLLQDLNYNTVEKVRRNMQMRLWNQMKNFKTYSAFPLHGTAHFWGVFHWVQYLLLFSVPPRLRFQASRTVTNMWL